MRAAAAITSITMKGGTALRADGAKAALALSSMADPQCPIAAPGRLSCAGLGSAPGRIAALPPHFSALARRPSRRNQT